MTCMNTVLLGKTIILGYKLNWLKFIPTRHGSESSLFQSSFCIKHLQKIWNAICYINNLTSMHVTCTVTLLESCLVWAMSLVERKSSWLSREACSWIHCSVLHELFLHFALPTRAFRSQVLSTFSYQSDLSHSDRAIGARQTIFKSRMVMKRPHWIMEQIIEIAFL